MISRQLAYRYWASLCLCTLVVSTFVNRSGSPSGCSIARLYAFSSCYCMAVSCLSQKLGTALGPGDFQLLVFINAVCNSSWVMPSQGWHSVSVYFNSSLFIHSAEWLCSLSFSKMLSQNVSVASFFGVFFFNWHLSFTKVSEQLISLNSWAFAKIFILRDSLVVGRSWFVVVLCFLFLIFFLLGDLLGFTFLCHVR